MALFQFLPHRVLAAVILAVAGLCLIGVELTGREKVPHTRLRPAAAHAPAAPAAAIIPPIAAEPNRFLPITPARAEELNDERPLADRPLQPAAPTYLPTAWDNLARETSRRCLATAIYYEAAGEGWHGELGVAQVVLNRVRHPAYPKSICGVVYQGANLPTGCQFTFTCDGRLAHPPSPIGWKQALAVADAALSGTVEPRVGMSTHYHTRSVVPYWAPSLDKLAVMGNHIFYTFAGSAGSRRAFTGQLLADAQLPVAMPLQADAEQLDSTGQMPRGAATPAVPTAPLIEADRHGNGALAADHRGTLVAVTRSGALRADGAGQLSADGSESLR